MATRRKKDTQLQKYVDVLNYILEKLSPNYNEEGRDLHRNNIYFASEVFNKYGITEKQIYDDINCGKYGSLKKFKNVIDEIREEKLLQQSLTRSYDGNFSKFVLSNKFKYAEKSENINKNEMTLKDFNISDLIQIEKDDE